MNLVKELKKEQLKSTGRTQQEITELLNTVIVNVSVRDEEQKRVLGYFGTSQVISHHVKELKTTKELLRDGLLTRKQVGNICKKYRLKCLRASAYKKEIPLRVLDDISEYEEAIGRKLKPKELRVIAPESHFNLGPRPKKDPVALHKREDGTYRIISQWGNDFSVMRRISSHILNYAYIYCFIIVSIVAQAYIPMPWWGLQMLITTVWAIVTACWMVHEDDYEDANLNPINRFDPFKDTE